MIDKRKHVLPKKRILLPNVIPWESGSNKFASLKGTLPFGGYRSIVPNIITPPYFKESEETSIPFLTCPPLKANIASQKGQRPFGSFRNEICCVTVGKDKKRVEDCMPNKVKNMAVLPKMRIPNKEAKRDEIFGHFRGQKLEVFGGPQLTEDNAKICDNTLPKFHDVQNTRAAEFKKNAQAPLFQSFVSDPKTEQQLSEQYRAWMGGQLTIKSDRPVNMKKSSNLSFFDKLMSEKDMSATELYYSKVDASELRDKLKIVEREQNDIDV
uniref:Uncharacterized protein n=1 Tax=Rhabditophanes sp. KR3021 TaxID=114890 RepID=A0AC35TK04_9BILA